VLIRKFRLAEYFKLPSIQQTPQRNLTRFFRLQIGSPATKFLELNENTSEPVIHHGRPTQAMSPTNLTESIEQKVRDARGSKTSIPGKRSTDRFIIQYKFVSRKDYRDFFNSLSPGEASYLESPIPPDIRQEADGSVVVGFRFPS